MLTFTPMSTVPLMQNLHLLQRLTGYDRNFQQCTCAIKKITEALDLNLYSKIVEIYKL